MKEWMPIMSRSSFTEWTHTSSLIYTFSRQMSELSYAHIFLLPTARDYYGNRFYEYSLGASIVCGIFSGCVDTPLYPCVHNGALCSIRYPLYGSTRWDTSPVDFLTRTSSPGSDTDTIFRWDPFLVFSERCISMRRTSRGIFYLYIFLPSDSHSMSTLYSEKKELLSSQRYFCLVLYFSFYASETSFEKWRTRYFWGNPDMDMSRWSSNCTLHRSVALRVSRHLVSHIYIYFWSSHRYSNTRNHTKTRC